ncbi:MAG: peptidoglycan-binding protein [Bacteroidia bacterium]|nr:peptidoglycan-binding protein [Bacteroidia bacterium]
MSILYIGHHDQDSNVRDKKAYLKPFHNVGDILRTAISFRDDDRSKWRKFKRIKGSKVRELQTFLFDAGFMPRSAKDGIFGYVTQASVRLFQEYMRTVEGQNMKPDGFVGSGTWGAINSWPKGKKCEWALAREKPTEEYNMWLNLLGNAKKHYSGIDDPTLKQIKAFDGNTDTLKPTDWKFNKSDIHLIGIRIGESDKVNRRKNDDIFILLINGLVFKFWGSTDPSQSMAFNAKTKKGRFDEAFLVEGQHKYRFAWHKISSDKKIYRALRPYKYGVLVFRDRDNDDALTLKDIKKGLDKNTNQTINIHWSGIGKANFSAGCQVIAGKSYINHSGKVVDCSGFAAKSYGDLTDSRKKTKGAYNMFTDLILAYAPQGVEYLYYTLGRDESLNISGSLSESYASNTLASMKNI